MARTLGLVALITIVGAYAAECRLYDQELDHYEAWEKERQFETSHYKRGF